MTANLTLYMLVLDTHTDGVDITFTSMPCMKQKDLVITEFGRKIKIEDMGKIQALGDLMIDIAYTLDESEIRQLSNRMVEKARTREAQNLEQARERYILVHREPIIRHEAYCPSEDEMIERDLRRTYV